MDEVVFMLHVKRSERGLMSLEDWVDEGVLDTGEEDDTESLFSSPADPWVPFSSFSAVLNMGLGQRWWEETNKGEGEQKEDKLLKTQ